MIGQQPTAKTYAQNALFFALFSLFVAFAITGVWFAFGNRMATLRSMPSPGAGMWIGRTYFWSWLLSTCILTLWRFVQLHAHGKRAEAIASASASCRTSERLAVWTRRWFLSRTYYLKEGDRILYTLVRRGKKACMYNGNTSIEIDDSQVVADEITGQCLAEADLEPNRLLTTPMKPDKAITGSIRTADSTIYRVALAAGEAKLVAQAGSRFVSIQGPAMTVVTNDDLADKQVAAVCLILSSFLVLGGPDA